MSRVRRVLIVLHAITLGGQVVAERTFLNDILSRIEPADARPCATFGVAVGTGHQTGLAADALFLVDEDHVIVRIAIGGTGRTGRDTGRVHTLLALDGKPVHLDVRVGACRVDRYYMIPVVTKGNVVLELTGDYTGVATGTTVQVDDQGSVRHY
jgi:hypothetical protein